MGAGDKYYPKKPNLVYDLWRLLFLVFENMVTGNKDLENYLSQFLINIFGKNLWDKSLELYNKYNKNIKISQRVYTFIPDLEDEKQRDDLYDDEKLFNKCYVELHKLHEKLRETYQDGAPTAVSAGARARAGLSARDIRDIMEDIDEY